MVPPLAYCLEAYIHSMKIQRKVCGMSVCQPQFEMPSDLRFNPALMRLSPRHGCHVIITVNLRILINFRHREQDAALIVGNV